MSKGTEIKTSSLALRYFTASITYLVLASTLGMLMVTGIAYTIFPGSRLITAHAHVALIGWVSITIMGAMYQIVPTLLGKKLYGQRFANIQFWLMNIGVVGIFLTPLFHMNKLFIASGITTALASYLFSFMIYGTVKGSKLELTMKFFVSAIAYFIVTVTLGVLIATGSAFKLFPGGVVTSHAHLALLGWASVTIIGAMYQMLPMLSLRELYSKRMGEIIFWLVNVGIIGFFAGTLFDIKGIIITFGAVIAISAYLFAYDMFRTLRREVKTEQKGLDLSVKFFVFSIVYLLIAVSMGVLSMFKPLPLNFTIAHVHIALVGWVSITIMGAMYHLVPMLVWMDRYADKMGVEPVPLLKNLYSEKLGKALLYFINICLLGFFFSLLLDIKILEIIFGFLIFTAFIVFAYAMLSVIKG